MQRIKGLDSIRFLCALIVVLGHLGLFALLKNQHGLAAILGQVVSALINGPAAVIVFFLISGLCIHYPYRNGRTVDLRSFYTRRLTRIGLPLLATIGISDVIGYRYAEIEAGILWSLIAEIIYYLLYPLLLLGARRYGWRSLIAVAFVAAYALIATKPHVGDYPSFGNALNWVIGLPIWLLGCLLAERSDSLPTDNAKNIWFYRAMVVGASLTATMLRYHTPHISIGYSWSLNLFGVVAYFWLIQEIIYRRHHEPIRWLEKAGLASYSLYLIHLPGAYLSVKIPLLNNAQGGVHALISLVMALCSAYVFYILVERSSHHLAVRLGKLSASQPAAAVPVT